MKQFIIIGFISLLALNKTQAQHDHSGHNHTSDEHSHKIKPPHGGEIKDVGKYHLEIVFNHLYAKEQFQIYILNSKLKPLELKDVTGTVKLNYKNGTDTSYNLTCRGDFLFASFNDATSSFDAVVSITYKGKVYTTTYIYKGI